MSFEKMIQVRDNSRFKGTTKWVLMAIAVREGANGQQAWPSVETIARDVGAGKSTVSRIICSLEHDGVLKVTRRANKTSKYTVDLSIRDPSDREVTPLKLGGPDPSDREGEYTRESTSEHTPAVKSARVIDMKAEEIARALKDEGPPLNDKDLTAKLNSTRQTLSNATKVWRTLCSKHHSMHVPELTQKEMGQLNLFLKRAPQGRQLSVLAYAIRHWDLFSTQVSRDFGWSKSSPRKPQVGFLLAGVATAVDLLDAMPENERGGLNENKGSQFYSDF